MQHSYPCARDHSFDSPFLWPTKLLRTDDQYIANSEDPISFIDICYFTIEVSPSDCHHLSNVSDILERHVFILKLAFNPLLYPYTDELSSFIRLLVEQDSCLPRKSQVLSTWRMVLNYVLCKSREGGGNAVY